MSLPATLPKIDGYKTLKFLGKGKHAEVYLGERESDHSLFACKVIQKHYPKHSIKGALQEQRISNEVTLLEKLQHPNIIRLCDQVNETARTILFMEYGPEFTELSNFLKNGPLSNEQVMKIFGQLVAALKYAHDQNIVYQNLEPEKILIDPKTHSVKLIGWGRGSEVMKDENGKACAAFLACQTLAYRSPESLLEKPYDSKKSDLWKLGVLLFLMCEGLLPFENKDELALANQIVRGDYTPFSSADMGVKSLIEALLNIHPDQRPPLDQVIQHPLCKKYSEFFPKSTPITDPFESDNKQIVSSNEFPQIQGYKTIKLLGVGKYSKVYLCEREADGWLFACKVIEKLDDLQMAEKARKRIDREVAILTKLSHPNIIRLYSRVDEAARTLLFMEYFPDSTELFYFIVSNKPSTESVMKIFGQLVMALKHAHGQNAIHRDLKPENILINPKTLEVKLIDFGFGRNINQGSNKKDKFLKTVCGTLNYISPEILSKKFYDGKKSDLWSVGIVLHALMLGYLPFDHENSAIAMRLTRKGKFDLPTSLDESMQSLIRSLIVVNPSKRLTIEQIIQHPACAKYPQYFEDNSDTNNKPIENLISSQDKQSA